MSTREGGGTTGPKSEGGVDRISGRTRPHRARLWTCVPQAPCDAAGPAVAARSGSGPPARPVGKTGLGPPKPAPPPQTALVTPTSMMRRSMWETLIGGGLYSCLAHQERRMRSVCGKKCYYENDTNAAWYMSLWSETSRAQAVTTRYRPSVDPPPPGWPHRPNPSVYGTPVSLRPPTPQP